MANTIKIKNSGTASNVPGSLEYGELALNYADGKLYYKNSSASIVQFSAPSTAASSYVATGRLNTDQTITNGSDTLIAFIDDADPNNWWDPTTKRFTPTIAGYYAISFSAWWSTGSVATNQFNTQVRKNGNTIAIYQSQMTTSSGQTHGGTKVIYLNGSTDYVDFTAYNGDSSSRTLQYGSSSGQGTHFSAALMTVGKGDKGDTGATGATGPAGASGATLIDDLTDVTITSAASGNILEYNGSAWINKNTVRDNYIRMMMEVF